MDEVKILKIVNVQALLVLLFTCFLEPVEYSDFEVLLHVPVPMYNLGSLGWVDYYQKKVALLLEICKLQVVVSLMAE
ncbi:predicted protein [Sclerotinia sclerotiorum 1980 UF-70]|uniref:Uncharacterized protein n=1 Tax=Sclerotinia sclerotiorum (strain ATCC 18683 / 1980 / Ss-1) TaxID=665079 RepID=A7ENI1_SCLS1|nr:predicted protein [Sclerotinia sclerotiorum 1980 UF-70]EDO04397.1 predicted protein [Sclerotinia sclerotiorum 1980 UF-70]